MTQPFTDHVRSLAEDSEVTDDVIEPLRGAIRRQLRQRGMLDNSPSLFGYVGRSWGDTEPMEDLVADCYVFAILKRLRALKSQLKRCESIDGYVRLNIQHFLTERQKKANPGGHALFKNLEATLCEAVELSILSVDGLEEGRIHAECLFRVPEAPALDPVPPETLREAVTAIPSWSRAGEELGRVGVRAQELAFAAVQDLLVSGVTSFRLRDLMDALSDQIRTGEAGTFASRSPDSLWDDSGVGFWSDIRTSVPDFSYEEQEHFNTLVEQMVQAIAELERRASVRERIRTVFDFIVEVIRRGENIEDLTYADVGRSLRIARATLGEDIQRLRMLSEQMSGEN